MAGLTRQQRRARERARAKADRRAANRRVSRARLSLPFPRVPDGVQMVLCLTALVLILSVSVATERDAHQARLVREAVAENGYTLISARDVETLTDWRWYDECGRADAWDVEVDDEHGQRLRVRVCVDGFSAQVLN